jgi:hypothetical protein
LHYYLDLRPLIANGHNPTITNGEPQKTPRFTLEQRLFHELHDNKIHSPSIKEFNEAFAYLNAVRSVFGSSKENKNAFDYVIDVAGGHGALAALFLITTSAKHAMVIDPARVGVGGVQRAWGKFWGEKELQFRHECLRTGLPAALDRALETTTADRILVVACHACQHLSDEVLQISCRHGVHAAVMPCCQKDLSPGSSWKSTSKNLGIPIEKTMDLLLAGKCMSWGTGDVAKVAYDVRMKLIDPAISPQNRVIVCRARKIGDERRQDIAKAHHKLEVAYRMAHRQALAAFPIFRGHDFSSGIAVGFLLALAVLHVAKR